MRRRASSSTARSGRERLAPRTRGMTQNAHPNVQPSCTLTNARVRSRRGAGPTQRRRAELARDALRGLLDRLAHDRHARVGGGAEGSAPSRVAQPVT